MTMAGCTEIGEYYPYPEYLPPELEWVEKGKRTAALAMGKASFVAEQLGGVGQILFWDSMQCNSRHPIVSQRVARPPVLRKGGGSKQQSSFLSFSSNTLESYVCPC
jgi:hypothetical protein